MSRQDPSKIPKWQPGFRWIPVAGSPERDVFLPVSPLRWFLPVLLSALKIRVLLLAVWTLPALPEF